MLAFFICHVIILLCYKPRYCNSFSDNDTGFQVIVVWFPAVKREVLLFQSLPTSSALHSASYSANTQRSVSLATKQLCGEADPLPLSSAVVKNMWYMCSAHFFSVWMGTCCPKPFHELVNCFAMWKWHLEVLSFEFMMTFLIVNVFIIQKYAHWWRVSCRELAVCPMSSVGTSQWVGVMYNVSNQWEATSVCGHIK